MFFSKFTALFRGGKTVFFQAGFSGVVFSGKHCSEPSSKSRMFEDHGLDGKNLLAGECRLEMSFIWMFL